MRIKKRMSLLAVAAASAMLLAGCAGGGESEATVTPEPAPTFAAGSTMEKLAEAGTITIGTKFDQPLFGLVGPDGTPEGFDVEIGKIIAAKLGIAADKITWTETVSANREPFIQNGQVDVVVATYTINDKRKEVISFAGPYYLAGQSILTGRRQTSDITSVDDLVGQERLLGRPAPRSIQRIKDEHPEATDDGSDGHLLPVRRAAATTGQVDAVTTDEAILIGYRRAGS